MSLSRPSTFAPIVLILSSSLSVMQHRTQALRVEHIIFAQECKRDIGVYKTKIARELGHLLKTLRNVERCHCTPGCQR